MITPIEIIKCFSTDVIGELSTGAGQMNETSALECGVLLDCTLRDGGYYNNWDFSADVIDTYLKAVAMAGVNVVEIGFRTLQNEGFKGPCAFSRDAFIDSLEIPVGLAIAVMINTREILSDGSVDFASLSSLFPKKTDSSPVAIVRLACKASEFVTALPASKWLKDRGYVVCFNLMQIADINGSEIQSLATKASNWPIDVLYFADSLGGMNGEKVVDVIKCLRKKWAGAIGIHAHDNLGLALANTITAHENGVSWLDATVMGMGRGPGNAKMELLAVELEEKRGRNADLAQLLNVIERIFKPLQQHHSWGTNTFYYLSAKKGLHPSYVQQMLKDERFKAEDILQGIENLSKQGGKTFNATTIDASRKFFNNQPKGSWRPSEVIGGRDVLILGSGEGVKKHGSEIERYIKREQPFVLALNTKSVLDEDLVNARIACHPIRLSESVDQHLKFNTPLIAPYSMMPSAIQQRLSAKQIYDFGLYISDGAFEFHELHCVIPNTLVMSYALAVASSGRASRILLAGFDGYVPGDSRAMEADQTLKLFQSLNGNVEVVSVTPTNYSVRTISVYGL